MFQLSLQFSWDSENAIGHQECEIFYAHQENISLQLVGNPTQKWPFIPLVLIV